MVDPLPPVDEATERQARRDFLIRCGRFAAVTPPAMTTLLAVSSIPREAHASTIGRGGGDGDERRRWMFIGFLLHLFG
jgi:hypothetical protein